MVDSDRIAVRVITGVVAVIIWMPWVMTVLAVLGIPGVLTTVGTIHDSDRGSGDVGDNRHGASSGHRVPGQHW